MKKILKVLFVLVIIFFTSFMSYRHSSFFFNFYQSVYYKTIYNESQLIKKFESMYKSGQYEKIIEIAPASHSAYPENHKLKMITSASYLKLKRDLEAAELFSSTLNGNIDDYFMNENKKIPKILFDSKNYGDLASMYDHAIKVNDVNNSFYYSVALFKKGRMDESFERIKYAFENGYIGLEINYYLGLIYEKKAVNKRALFFLKRAYDYNKRDIPVRVALIRVLRNEGLYSNAEKIMRNNK